MARLKPFEEVVAEHGPRVLRVCRALLAPADAEDAWAETFLAALQAYPELAPGSNVQAWLVTIAHRKAIDVTRRRAREPVPVEALPERPVASPLLAGQERELHRALEALPPKQREAVAYHYLGGLAYKEVAAITGGSADAARRAAADGIASLRRTFLATNDPEGETR